LVNSPNSSKEFFILHEKHNTTNKFQIALFYSSGFTNAIPEMYMRAQNGGTWSTWSQIATQYWINNGGGINYNSTVNGDYTKFADGTLICSAYVELSSNGTDFYSGTWTYPAAFISNPTSFQITAYQTASGAIANNTNSTYGTSISNTQAKWGVKWPIAINTVYTIRIQLFAIGRWK
jgi:hypothetical protein